MSLKQWAKIQEALENKFCGGVDNSVGGEWLGPVLDQEREYGASLVRTYRGFDIAECAFFDFFIKTFHIAAVGAFKGQLPNSDQQYVMLYLTYISLFRGLRAASALKTHGYPSRAFGALRDQKNRAIHIGAIINGYTDINAIHGIDLVRKTTGSMTFEEYKKITARRSKSQKIAMSKMIGRDSGLAGEDIKEFELLRDMYHDEVHGGYFTFVNDLRTILVDKKLPSFGPEAHYDNIDAAMYINRAVEVEWMVLRSLPYLQLHSRAFGNDWADLWKLLDVAFRMLSESLGEQGKPIGDIFPRMMDAKFAFDPELHYKTVG